MTGRAGPRWLLAVSVLALGALWLGPLPALAGRSFAAHMILHLGVVAGAAPLLALGLAGGRMDPVRRAPALFAPMAAAGAEMVIVWGWHAPALHHAARASAGALALEQASFLAAGLLVWLSVCGGSDEERPTRAGGGVAALLLTSMHMTVLGALLALAPRPIYHDPGRGPWGLTPLADQQLGGTLMLTVGGAVYLIGALWLMAGLLRPAHALPRAAGESPR